VFDWKQGNASARRQLRECLCGIGILPDGRLRARTHGKRALRCTHNRSYTRCSRLGASAASSQRGRFSWIDFLLPCTTAKSTLVGQDGVCSDHFRVHSRTTGPLCGRSLSVQDASVQLSSPFRCVLAPGAHSFAKALRRRCFPRWDTRPAPLLRSFRLVRISRQDLSANCVS
jgi:hypothetical protein